MTPTPPPLVNAPTAAQPSRRGVRHWLAVAALAVFLSWALTVGLRNSLNGHHAFRQTQNAAAIVGFDQEGLSLSQVLPSIGPPWRVTQELPLYQWTTFAAWKLTGADLAVTGRLVSIAWFVLVLVLLWQLVSKLADERTAWIATVLTATSPLYLFWSRSFMMESTAVATALAFGLGLRWFLTEGGIGRFAVAALLGALAVMVKPSSFMGGALVVGLTLLAAPPRTLGRFRLLVRAVILAAVVGVVFFAWSGYARRSMASLVLNDWLAAPEYLKWFTGDLKDRVNPAKWANMAGHLFPNLLGGPLWIFLFLTAALLKRERSWLTVTAFIAAAAPVLVFFNVFAVHDYYHYESAYLLLVGIAVVLAGLTRDPERAYRSLGWLLVAAFVAGSLHGYSRYYLKIQRWNPTEFRDFARSIRDHTQPGDYLVVYGFEYSPELAFYAERRCFQDVENRALDHAIWGRVLKDIPRERIGGLVICGTRRNDPAFVKTCLESLGLTGPPALSYNDQIYKRFDADVYLRPRGDQAP